MARKTKKNPTEVAAEAAEVARVKATKAAEVAKVAADEAAELEREAVEARRQAK